jgi:hypothetical protein
VLLLECVMLLGSWAEWRSGTRRRSGGLAVVEAVSSTSTPPASPRCRATLPASSAGRAFSGGAGAGDVADLLHVLRTGASFKSHQVQLRAESPTMQQLGTKIQYIRTNMRQ